MDRLLFNEKLEKRITRLQEILNRGLPIDPKMEFRHEELQRSARQYLREIKQLNSFDLPEEIFIVSHKSFQNKMKECDMAVIEDEGTYFSLAHVEDFPKSYYMIWLTPFKEL